MDCASLVVIAGDDGASESDAVARTGVGVAAENADATVAASGGDVITDATLPETAPSARTDSEREEDEEVALEDKVAEASDDT